MVERFCEIGIDIKLEKLPSIKDWGQTDRVTTPTHAGLHCCHWHQPHHATCLTELACSRRHHNKNLLRCHPSVLIGHQSRYSCSTPIFASTFEFQPVTCQSLTRWAGTRKVKPIWILLEQETVSGRGISWAICKSAPRSRQITTPAPHHSVFYRLDALPAAQSTASKHWRRLLVTTVYNKQDGV